MGISASRNSAGASVTSARERYINLILRAWCAGTVWRVIQECIHESSKSTRALAGERSEVVDIKQEAVEGCS